MRRCVTTAQQSSLDCWRWMQPAGSSNWGRLQRTNPTEAQAEYNRQFADLLALEQYRRQLRERALGEA